jgi:hypothetical protein
MPANFYGSGLYGTGLFYGRIGAGLAAAQNSKFRETALKVSIIDERVNRWEVFTGNPNPDIRTLFMPLGNNATLQTYWSYRSQAAAIQLGNGNIVRVRIGDGTISDFAIYSQTITDPTIASQWNTWGLLYSGTHYAVAIAVNGSTVHVYSAKSDGLYRDNALKWSKAGIIGINPIVGTFDALFVQTVREDPIDGEGKRRDIDLWYTDDIQSSAPVYDPVNYRWYSTSIVGFLLDDGTVLRYQTMPRYAPRSNNNGDSITVAKMPTISNNIPSAPRLIRGLAGEVGHNQLRGPKIFTLEDGFYYLFYSEAHRDGDYDATENPGHSTQWQRSKDGIHWSEPVTSGTPIPAALITHSGYVWMPTYDLVYRRPSTPMIYDVTNYVPSLNFEIPRDNQESSGTCSVANPNGVNDQISNFSDRKLKIEIGLKTPDGTYEYAEYNDWWIKRIIGQIDGAASRLSIEFGDVWVRLSSAFRDTFNFIGQLKWKDWNIGLRNKAFNYYFLSDTGPKDTGDKLVTKGIVLYTGWKGQNATAQVHFSGVTGDPAFIFRYIDTKNYQRIEKQGSTLRLIDKVNNVDIEMDSAACASDTSPVIKMVFRWEYYEAYVNGVLIFSGTYPDQPNVKPGYVGFKATAYTITAFYLDDWEPPLNAEELIRTALAMGDYHDVITGESSSEELAIVWGPQTDAPTPADGLRQALEATKWDLVWTDGRVRVGSFKDTTVTRIIDDRIIKTDYVDEASRRINLASVDGNENTWLENDVVDTQQRDRQISAYFDLPELTDQDSVTERAIEEIRKGKLGRTPGGDVVLYFDLWRMDVVTWIDNAGKSEDVRVEGISAEIEQNMQPSQRETLDTSLINA